MFRISFNNPFNWIANKLSPNITEKEDKASHELARKKKAEEGTGNLFDAVAVGSETDKPTLATSVVPRKKHKEVCLIPRFIHLSDTDPPVTALSTSTRQPTSRFLRGNLINSGDRLRANPLTMLSFR